ncbi:MAG: hypothetical protein CL678_05880 [Bdellovibrionaceae bacterium]|nr:hypothetical protein [Pseudobdellovibrionaceae bacterium]
MNPYYTKGLKSCKRLKRSDMYLFSLVVGCKYLFIFKRILGCFSGSLGSGGEGFLANYEKGS